MTGEYRHNLDAKGRLFIPAKLKEELGDVFYITLSTEKCLYAYSSESWQKISDKVDSMSYLCQKSMRPLFAFAAKCELDNQGRILIPQHLREYAGLAKNVAVVGCNRHAEIWDENEWNRVRAEEMSFENMTKVMRELEF